MHHTAAPSSRHSHNYALDTSIAERRTRIVIALTATMMIVEIAAGLAYNSMSLLADGWHMSTHVAAFLITAIAYSFGRRHSVDARYSFGTGKMGVLGGFTSAIVLFMVAAFMAGESVYRIFTPVQIHYDEAIAVAVAGLAINLICALIFKDDHHHEHGAGHRNHHDLNMRAAYLHVLADAFTSVTAIGALLSGKLLGWAWLDPVMGLVGSAVVSVWAYGLLRDSSGILLDRTPDSSDLPKEIRRAVEGDGDSLITDLHIWQIAAGKFAAIVAVVAHEPKSSDAYRAMLLEHEELAHVTVEVSHCPHRETASC